MKVFIIVFSLALLFVIGTAGAMRYFGGNDRKKSKKR